MPNIDDTYLADLKKQIDEIESKELPALGDPLSEEADELYRKILRLVSFRERSSAELRTRFSRELFDEQAVEQAIERAQRSGMIDDLRFAESLIRAKLSAGKGRRGIEFELEKNGIDASHVPGWPDDFFDSDEEEIDRAIEILKRKPPTAKNKRDAAYRRLVSKGYSSSVAARATRIWMDNLE